MSTVNQPKRPARRRSVLQRLVGDDTLSIVKRHTAKVELDILQRNENAAQNNNLIWLATMRSCELVLRRVTLIVPKMS